MCKGYVCTDVLLNDIIDYYYNVLIKLCGLQTVDM